MAKRSRTTPPASIPVAHPNSAEKTVVAATDEAKSVAAATDAVKTDAVKSVPARSAALATTVQSAILFPVLPSSDAPTIRSRELVFTLDGWRSLQVLRSSEAPQAFSENQVLLDGVPPGTPVEFALRLELAGHSLWLNNGGRNYRQLSA
ncbi:MAG: CBM21 domain-containing protein [Myxococcota bacterium]|nr:CBM21 domain-containing protein [Myxococcota bacterium]